MRKRVHIALALLLTVVVGVIVWQVWRPRGQEPEYQGRGLRAWLRDAKWERNPERRVRAEGAIRHIGTNAIPTLLAMLREQDSPLVSRLVPWWGRHIAGTPYLPSWIRFPPWYTHQAQLVALEATHGFEILGADAEQTVNSLMDVYEQDISPASRMAASSALCVLAAAAPDALPSFLGWAASSNQSVRVVAVCALSRARYRPGLVVPALSKSLSDADNVVRTFAAQGLESFGADARPASAELVRALADTDPYVRRAAAQALKAIDAEAAAKAGVK